MNVKDIFTPDEAVITELDVLQASIQDPEDTTMLDYSNNRGDCTGCWGGTCASGITG